MYPIQVLFWTPLEVAALVVEGLVGGLPTACRI